MKIAFYAPLKEPDHPVPSGDRRMARLLIRALEMAGHEVTVANQLRSYEGKGDQAVQAQIRAQAEDEVTRLQEELQADLWFSYHLYHKAPDYLGPELSRFFGIPYWIAEASYAPKQANGPWAEGHHQVAAALSQADKVLGLSPVDKACVQPLLADPARYRDIKPFLDTAPFRMQKNSAADSRARLAKQYGIDPDRPWLICAAMMRDGDKLASYRLLASSLEQLIDRDWQLLILGDGPARAQVEGLFQSMQNCHFLGEIAPGDMPAYFNAADLYVWPGINEAYGLAPLEAQASGLAVISANRPGIAAMIADGQTGLLCREGNQAAFANAIRELLDNPQQLEQMGISALEKARAYHDIQQIAAFLKQELAH